MPSGSIRSEASSARIMIVSLTNQSLPVRSGQLLALSDPSANEGAPAMANDTERFIRTSFADDARKGFELLYREYYGPLCSHAVRFVYSKDVAKDIVGDVFYVFWQQQTQTHITSSFGAYLYTAVRHRSLKYLQREFARESHWSDSATLDQASMDSTPEEILNYEELYHKVEQLISHLSPQTQKVFLMNRFENKKYQAIADELQLSVKTIETHMSKALSILRKGLKNDFLVLLLLTHIAGIASWILIRIQVC